MENENTTTTTTTVENTTDTYLAEIERLKDTTVSKEDYNKLVEENKKLIGTLARNEKRETEAAKPAGPTLKELNAALCADVELSNLDYAKLSLAQRKAAIAAGKNDPYLPYGHNIKPTPDDIRKADLVAQTLQECIDEANGSSNAFTARLQDRLAPDSPAVIAAIKKSRENR